MLSGFFISEIFLNTFLQLFDLFTQSITQFLHHIKAYMFIVVYGNIFFSISSTFSSKFSVE